MIVKRFYDDTLAQASYLIGCGRTGNAIVIDPSRDIDQYLRMAETEEVAVTHVTETHIHADFVSGSRELAVRTGAALYLSAEGGPDWQYAYARDAGAVLVRDGDHIMVGNVRLDVVHTPGHTPEHLAFLVTDTAAAPEPMAIVTGDFVFVGDVGRPDLLEKAAKVQGTMEAGARTLFRSVQRFKAYPDYLQLWPGHGAGSACGKGLSAVPQSTVGYERRFNWALGIEGEDDFVRQVLTGQPEPPAYFAEMKRINRDGPRILNGFATPQWLPEVRLPEVLARQAFVIDARPAAEFAAGHVPGTINIPLNRSFTTWAGWLTPFDEDFYLIVDDSGSDRGAHNVNVAARELAMIGLDRFAGYFGVNAVKEWGRSGHDLQTIRQVTSTELAGQLARGAVSVIDVRGQSEWEAGHLPGIPNIPVGYLVQRLAEVPRDRPVVVHCQGGGRSAIAASVLQAHGIPNVVNLSKGYQEWATAGLPVEREADAVPAGH
jgi:hydroxyacylglutathione hydrolase